MTQQTAFFPIAGGLDLVTPWLTRKPGLAIDGINYEPAAEGYRRLRGFERFDGRPSPSDAGYWRLNYINGENNAAGTAPVAGETIRAQGSNTIVGYVLAVVTTSGAWANDNAAGYIVATGIVGTLTGTTPHVAANPAPGAGFQVTAQTASYDFGAVQNIAYLQEARALARAHILVVPGSGAVRGVNIFENALYAFRDNAGATAGTMQKAGSTGWVEVAPLTRIDFTCDTATQTMPNTKIGPSPPGSPQQAANVSSGSSDGDIRSVTIVSTVGTVNTCFMMVSGYNAGSWTTAGQTIYKAATAVVFGTTAAAPVTPTISAGGRYCFTNHNFYGAADYAAMYAVNGTGKALVYDGAGFANITTGMTVDTPTRVAVHKQSLFLGFPGGSVQFSIVGEPTIFDPILGAGEIAIGHDIADFIAANQGTLAILGEESISVLYGNDSTDYALEMLSEESGALPFTAQRLGQVIYMDNRGIRTLSASQQFGNFQAGTISRLVAPLIEQLLADQVFPVATFLSRARDQYWLIFQNGQGIIIYMGKKDPEILTFNLSISVTCACWGEINGVERIFVGAQDGFVYEMNRGNSFDGDDFYCYVTLAWHHFGSPQAHKRVHKFGLDLEYTDTPLIGVEFALDRDFSAGSVGGQSLVLVPGGAEAYVQAQLTSISATVFTTSGEGQGDWVDPHTMSGATYHVSPRGLKR